MKVHVTAAACLFFSQLSSANLAPATPVETTISGRSVSLDLVKANDLSLAAWPDDHFEMTTETITTLENANIYDLLTARGIEPDVEAFTVVYDLNPLLKQIDPLPKDLILVVPKVTGGEKLAQKLRQGYLVMLTVDRALRDDLARSVSDLQDLSAKFSSLPSDRFISASTKESAVSDVKALVTWLAYAQKTFLQRTGPPLRRQTLLGIHDEAAAVNSILDAIVRGQERVTPADQEQVNAIYRDIQLQMKKYDNVMAGEPPAGDQQYEVIVTIRNGERLKNPQVYYTWEGLFRKPPKEPFSSKPFEKEVSGFLTFGDYVIWVGEPGHPYPPLTDQKPIRIDAAGGGTKSVVLSVLP